jgi:hypothetical protein
MKSNSKLPEQLEEMIGHIEYMQREVSRQLDWAKGLRSRGELIGAICVFISMLMCVFLGISFSEGC